MNLALIRAPFLRILEFRSDSKNVDDESDAYSVVSIANATLVLSIGDMVEEAIVVFLMLQHPLLFLR